MNARPTKASEVFILFEKGVSPIDVTKQLNVDPAKVLEWFKAYCQMTYDFAYYNLMVKPKTEREGRG